MRDLAVSEFTVLPPPPVVPLPRDDTGEFSTWSVSSVNGSFLFPLKCPHFGRGVLTAVGAFGRLREPYKGCDSLLALGAHP
jgi:hypothetical protein